MGMTFEIKRHLEISLLLIFLFHPTFQSLVSSLLIT